MTNLGSETTDLHLLAFLEANQKFVANQEYAAFTATKVPAQKTLVLSCMDARLSALLLPALGLRNGDVHVIKSAGAVITDPYGSLMRSILVSIYEFEVEHIFVIGHDDCGMAHLDGWAMVDKMRQRGISNEVIDAVHHHVDLENWLQKIGHSDESIRKTVKLIRTHPLLPANVKIHGLCLEPKTGALRIVNPVE
ncbi:MAG: beta-class carbonic anhydrase [Culicoidibacterales bacterium]